MSAPTTRRSRTISARAPATAKPSALGETFSLALNREQALRYGENPHQSGALYGRFLEIAHQLHGKELSFNNVVDISSAMNLMLEFQHERRAVVAILKHNTPCGVGVADTLKGAWDKAFATDPDSPFGGIIITNRPWDMEFARAVNELFTEVLIGPAYPDEVLAFLRKNKNRRVMTFNPEAVDRNELDVKKVLGGLLVQTPDLAIEDPRKGKVVTRRAPTDAEMRALDLRHQGLQTRQVQRDRFRRRRSHAGRRRRRDLAHRSGLSRRARRPHRLHVSLEGSVLVSEALFPFPDGPTLAAEAGATAIAQPGGSLRDDEVIEAADKFGLAMVFTGVRHFRHGSCGILVNREARMKVLVVGKGAREHCAGLAAPSKRDGVEDFLRDRKSRNRSNRRAGSDRTDRWRGAGRIRAKSKSVDLTIVGPEDPLAAGIVDEFTRAGLKIFGPTAAAAQLESSKSFAKTIMREAGVPTADFASFDDAESARHYVRSRKMPMVVKADGLALGKGVDDLPRRDLGSGSDRRRDGAPAFRRSRQSHRVEEFLTGEEVSFFALCDGENAIPLGTVQDHKTIFDGDRGPNTGGMGAYSPVPQFGPELDARVMREVVTPTLAAMNARGTPFRGAAVRRPDDRRRPNQCARIQRALRRSRMRSADDAIRRRSRRNPARRGRRQCRRAAVKLSPRSAVAVVLTSGGYPGRLSVRASQSRGLDRIEGNVAVRHQGQMGDEKNPRESFPRRHGSSRRTIGYRRRTRVDGHCDGART